MASAGAATSLDIAWGLHRAGRHEEAERACRGLVASDPSRGEAWLLAGLAQSRMGRHAEAEASYRRAIGAGCDRADVRTNLGTALALQGRSEEAAACFRRAVAMAPGLADAHANLGAALRDLGRLDEAGPRLVEALRLDPDHPAALATLADVYSKQGRPADLAEACRTVIAARPDHFEAHHRRGEAQAYLKDFEGSLASYDRAIRAVPRSPSAYLGRGIALAELSRDDEAVASFHRALAIHPELPAAWNNLGRVLLGLGREAEALDAYDEAIRLRPDYTDAHNDRGLVLNALRRFDDAIAAYERALSRSPEHIHARKNRAMAWLTLGDYARGWPELRWRWRMPAFRMPDHPQPLWTGQPLEGKTILLWGEQGAGDVIQFLRFVPMVRALGPARVIVMVSDELVPLVATCPGIDRDSIVTRVEVGPGAGFDYHAPLMDLPAVLGIAAETIPAAIPYLAAEPARVERWRDRLGALAGFKVGVAWQGNPANPVDRARSFPLARLEPLARVAGVRLVSLQSRHGVEQIAALNGRFPIHELGDDFDRGPGAFLDAAAVLASLDLVVVADSALAHLAGALGVPVWIPLSTAADWRWLDGRDDSPWYPSARLFRQDAPRAWDPVFDRIAAALAEEVSKRPVVVRPVAVEIASGELIDKITILVIKTERIADPAKLANVREELALLEAARDRAIPPSPDLDALTVELKRINEAIWDVEDALRDLERAGDFGPGFVERARSVYRNNDRRAAIKRAINDRLGSRLIEEKSYPDGWPTP